LTPSAASETPSTPHPRIAFIRIVSYCAAQSTA
jgi:hypothetical protein